MKKAHSENIFRLFTEESYYFLLENLLKVGYEFIDYRAGLVGLNKKNKLIPSVIWRHDIDMSVHRALSLAKIENQLGIKSTFFILLQSQFYDIREKDIREKLYQIKNLGHNIGLHFDFDYLATKIITQQQFETSLKLQLDTMYELLGINTEVFSYHNPRNSSFNLDKSLEICGLVNVYSTEFFDNFKYCSDSNGRWNDNIEQLINPDVYPRLHILTHPVWWTPEYIKVPRDKIIRAVEGRKNSIMRDYDSLISMSIL